MELTNREVVILIIYDITLEIMFIYAIIDKLKCTSLAMLKGGGAQQVLG